MPRRPKEEQPLLGKRRFSANKPNGKNKNQNPKPNHPKPKLQASHSNYYGDIPGMTFDFVTGTYSSTLNPCNNVAHISESLNVTEKRVEITKDERLKKNITSQHSDPAPSLWAGHRRLN
jgi:hypothetical protein